MPHPVTLTVNGVPHQLSLEPDRSLLSVIREDLGVTGPKEGCDDSECGACMVMLDGAPVNACSYLAVQADGREVTTVEGLTPNGSLSDLQRAFLDEGAAQCGFCTPGMIVSAEAMLSDNPEPTEEDVRIALSGNLCRCTGYRKIIRAVMRAADERRGSLPRASR
jgi:carbon-monoxide dehydrogenase small subunit